MEFKRFSLGLVAIYTPPEIAKVDFKNKKIQNFLGAMGLGTEPAL